MTALVALGHLGGVDLKVGTGQIVEQHIEFDVEQIAPAAHQMAEQVGFMCQQEVVAGIEFVRLGQTKIRAQKIGHGTAAEPLAVQLPLATRSNQSIRHQHL